MAQQAFRPNAGSNTVLVAASSSTSVAATQLIAVTGVPAVMLSNPSTVSIYIAMGSSSVSASMATTSVVGSMCLPAGRERVVSIGQTTASNWISAMTSAGTAAPGLFATPGSGQ